MITCPKCEEYTTFVVQVKVYKLYNIYKDESWCLNCFRKAVEATKMIYSPDDVRRMLAKLKQLDRYDIDNDGGCNNPDCCGGRAYFMSLDADGNYVHADDLEKAIKDIEDSL